MLDLALFSVTLTPPSVILSRQRRREDLDGTIEAGFSKQKHLEIHVRCGNGNQQKNYLILQRIRLLLPAQRELTLMYENGLGSKNTEASIDLIGHRN